MPLPSVLQGVQDYRLPALKPPKRFRRPPRQQLLQLHAPAICFSGGSRLPFARPQSPQTLPTLPQASKATTLTATTCPCHLFFRGFKTAVCPPSNPPNASNPPAGLQGNNSYSLHAPAICFSGGSRLPFARLKPPKRFQPSRRPPRQQLLQLHAPAICFSGRSRLPFARPQTPQTLPQASKATTLITATQASKATTLTATTCPCHLFFRGFKTAVCPPSNPPNASNPLAGLQGNNSYSYMPLPSVFQGVQDCRLPALKPPNASAGLQGNNSYSYMPLPSVFQGVQDCRLPALKPPNASAGLQGNNSYSYMPLPSVFQGVQDCRLPALKPPKRFRRPPRQQLLQLHASAICFSGGSRLPFARPQTPQTLPTLPQACKATTLTAKTVFQGVQDCCLPALNPPKRFQPSRRPPRQQLLQLHAPAICFSGGSRLPFARPQAPQTLPTLPQASKATTLTATCPCHLFFRGFKTAVCPPSNPPNASNPPAGLQGNNSLTATCPCHLFFRGFKTAVCPPSNPPNASAGLQGNNSYYSYAGLQGNNSYSYYMPLPSVFQGVQDCRLPALKPPNASAGLQGNNSYSYMPLPSVFQGVQDCRLPALKPPKRFRRPPRQQLLQLHAPAICFSGGSRLPLARPQTPQTLPQASKATTLTATCLCHLFFRGFKTAVCPPSNPPNASAGLQGNNSYSYMPLPSVFACRVLFLPRI